MTTNENVNFKLTQAGNFGLNIAWDTKVWIENNPDHMIHFNGPQVFTVYVA